MSDENIKEFGSSFGDTLNGEWLKKAEKIWEKLTEQAKQDAKSLFYKSAEYAYAKKRAN